MTEISVCTTNYNCAHALTRHLDSISRVFQGIDYEYVVVDNYSRDGSWDILQSWVRRTPKMTAIQRRCTMGEGREIAFRRSSATHILVVDTDVAYDDILRRFLDRYRERWSEYSVQALFCGIFPRDQWKRVGGRRSLNVNEDVDMWIRIHGLGKMRWYPVPMGENLKDPEAWGSADHRSTRYGRIERVRRLVRREWDLTKTRRLATVDLAELIKENTIDLDLGPKSGDWPQRRARETRSERIAGFVRDFRQVVGGIYGR